MSSRRTRKDLRCFCSRSPLLAVYGIDTDERPFIHVRVYKQSRIYGEFVLKGGDVSIKCRECYRWYRIFIRDNAAKLVESEPPVELQNTEDVDAGLSAEAPVV